MQTARALRPAGALDGAGADRAAQGHAARRAARLARAQNAYLSGIVPRPPQVSAGRDRRRPVG